MKTGIRHGYVVVTVVISFLSVMLVRPCEFVAQDSFAFVPVVAHSGEDRSLDWRFEKLWTVGGIADTVFGSVSRFNSANVEVDESGRIYVLQAAESRVAVVSDDGELIGTVGRRGSGPGELEGPWALAVTGDVLSVYDWMRGIVRWRLPEGVPMEMIRASVWMQPENNLDVSPDGFVFTEVKWLPREGDQVSARHHVTQWRPVGERRIMTGPEIDIPVSDFPSCGMVGMVVPRIFSPSVSWDASSDLLVIVKDIKYVIHVFKDHQPYLSIKRSLVPRKVTRRMAIREMEARDGRVRPSCVVSADEAVRALGFPGHLQALADVVLSPAEFIWALRGRVSDELRLIDVFSRDGEYTGTLPPGSPFPVAFASPDRILVAGTDSHDVPTLTLYRIRR